MMASQTANSGLSVTYEQHPHMMGITMHLEGFALNKLHFSSQDLSPSSLPVRSPVVAFSRFLSRTHSDPISFVGCLVINPGTQLVVFSPLCPSIFSPLLLC